MTHIVTTFGRDLTAQDILSSQIFGRRVPPGSTVQAEYIVASADALLTRERLLLAGSGIGISFATPGEARVSVPNGQISDLMLRSSAGNSVIGRAASGVGVVGDITATEGTALVMDNGALSFLSPGEWAQLLLAVQSYLEHQPRIPKVQAGSNVTVVENALGPVISASGGAGSANAAEVSIDLGTSGGLIFTTTVTGQAWVASGTKIVVSPAPTAADGQTVETYFAAGFIAMISNKVVGTGFDLTVYSPNGATGIFRFNCIGV